MSKRAMAAIYLGPDSAPFIIAETPSEATIIVEAALNDGRAFAELTLGNDSEWNAKPLYVKATSVFAISPPEGDIDEE